MGVVLSTGRINNAVAALSAWYQRSVGAPAGYNDRLVFLAHTRAVLEADDRYLVGQTMPKAADPDRLRLKIAKLQLRIEELKAKVSRAEEAKQAANERERRADEAIAEAQEKTHNAKQWQRSAEEYARQNAILREQLAEAGIEPDRRVG